MDDVSGNLESIIKELMNEGQERRVEYDNFDFRSTPGQLTKLIRIRTTTGYLSM